VDRPEAPSIKEEQLIASSMQVAEQLYHAEDYLGSAQATQQILDRYPKRDLLDTRYLLGLSLEHSRSFKEAIAVYQSIIKKAPRNTFANAASFRVGMCYDMMDDVPSAVHAYRDIIDFNSKSEYRMQAYIHLGSLYRRQTEWKLAQNIYRDIIRLYPCSTWSTTSAQYLAECFVHQEVYDEAIRIYSRMQADSCTPRFIAAQAQLHMGDLYLHQEKYQEAIKAYFKAQQLYNDVPGVTVYAQQKIEMAKDNRNSEPDAQIRRRNIDIRQSEE
jgi:pentatricopeptide repeat protein